VADDRDTIYALSSGRPPAAIAVIRISGPRGGFALERLIGRVPAPRRASLARVRDPASAEVIDEGLALWFPAPNSETGEDMAELQVHGGRAVITAVLAALGKLPGLRPAEAGEFTRRAFENGRMDLTAVEGLADLVAAETEAQRRQAFRHLKGLLGERAESWRQRLIEALALVEAGIDFSDEGDVPQDLLRRALELVGPLAEEIDNAGAGQGERLRSRVRRTPASRPCSIAWRGGRRRSSRRFPEPRATCSRCISISGAIPSRCSTPPASARRTIRSSARAYGARASRPRARTWCCGWSTPLTAKPGRRHASSRPCRAPPLGSWLTKSI
jgi:hypothetical protein